MRIGIPAEIKTQENRVALTPAAAHELVAAGHRVAVQAGAGVGSGLPDAAYAEAGADIVAEAAEAWAQDLVVKVKEPIADEYRYLRDDLVLFAYLHLAADRPLTDALLAAGTTAIAYETVQTASGRLPLLAPMSQVAGRLAAVVGAHTLLASEGGSGVLVSGVPGTRPARVCVIGAGVAGSHAAAVASGMGAEVTVIDRDLSRLAELDAHYAGRVRTLASTRYDIRAAVVDADLVIGSVLVPGARAPKLVTLDMVAEMAPGSVLVDVAIDQGGCFEGSRPTTHDDPTFAVHDALYYCVANMPGAVPATSTRALTNATLPYVRALADRGWEEAVAADPALAAGVSTVSGALASEPVAEAFGLAATPVTPRR